MLVQCTYESELKDFHNDGCQYTIFVSLNPSGELSIDSLISLMCSCVLFLPVTELNNFVVVKD